MQTKNLVLMLIVTMMCGSAAAKLNAKSLSLTASTTGKKTCPQLMALAKDCDQEADHVDELNQKLVAATREFEQRRGERWRVGKEVTPLKRTIAIKQKFNNPMVGTREGRAKQYEATLKRLDEAVKESVEKAQQAFEKQQEIKLEVVEASKEKKKAIEAFKVGLKEWSAEIQAKAEALDPSESSGSPWALFVCGETRDFCSQDQVCKGAITVFFSKLLGNSMKSTATEGPNEPKVTTGGKYHLPEMTI